MITRHSLAAALGVAAVILGVGGGIVATHTVGSAHRNPAVQGPEPGPVVDLPEPATCRTVPGSSSAASQRAAGNVTVTRVRLLVVRRSRPSRCARTRLHDDRQSQAGTTTFA